MRPRHATLLLGLVLSMTVSVVFAADTVPASARPPKAAAGASVASGPNAAMPAPKIDALVPLPISGLKAVVSNDELLYISDNGRYVLRGVMYDVWDQKPLKSLDDIRESATHINLAKMHINTADFKPLAYGMGPEHVTVFVDPKCPWCAKLMQQMKDKPELAKRYTFDLVPIPVLGTESQRLVRELGCARDRKAALAALMSETYDRSLEQEKDCTLQHVQKAMVAAQLLGVTGVPFLIHQDGRVQRGMPQELGDWLVVKR